MDQSADKDFISKEKFRQFVQQKLLPKLAAAETERKRIWKRWPIRCIMIGVGIAGLIYWLKNNVPSHGSPVPFYIIYGVIWPVFFVWIRFAMYIYNQKEKFIPIMLNELGLKVTQKVITRTFVRKSLLLDSLRYNDFKMDDAFSGTYRDTAFFVQEAFIKGQKPFKGLYIAIALDKPFRKRAMIYNTLTILPKKQKGYTQVEIEDVEFMKTHQILAQDQVEVRYILTPAFIERLKKMRTAFFAWRIDIAFFDHYAFFQVHTGRNMFEPFSSLKKATDMNAYMKLYDEIRSICEMISVLKIDNRKQEAELSKERREKQELKEKRKKARKMEKAISQPQNPAKKEMPFSEESRSSEATQIADDDEEELLNMTM